MTKTRVFFMRVLFATIALWVVLTLDAAEPTAAMPRPSDPNDQSFSQVASPLARQEFDALMSKSQAKGSVRVIVGLRTSYQPEGRLRNPQAIQAQRIAIGQAQNALLDLIASRNVKSVKKFAYIPYMAMEVDATALAALSSIPNVTSIKGDVPVHAALPVSVPLIGATNAWAMGYRGAGQVVAILDTGVDEAHPFLSGKVVSEACYSTTNLGDTATSLCPGGVSQSTAPGSGVNCSVSVSGCEHGTHVAGIAVGKDNGSIGFNGVAKDANIVAIQVFSRFDNCSPSPSPCVMAYDSDIILGLERVQTLSSSYGIAAVNLSLGGNAYTSQAACDADNPDYKAALDNLRSLNIATVIAAGNDGSTNSIEVPGCISSAISVGSTQDGELGTTADAVSGFSDSASFLDLLAPGEPIYSSVPGGGYEFLEGTSMATPHVTGAWAVLKSAVPSATVDQILLSLTCAGKPITDPRNGITKSRIRVDAAAHVLLNGCPYYFPFISK